MEKPLALLARGLHTNRRLRSPSVTGTPALSSDANREGTALPDGQDKNQNLAVPLWPPNGAVLVNAFSSPGRSTARPGVDGRPHGGIDEMGMQSEPCWPETVLTYVGGRAAKRAPQIAILNMRSAGRLGPVICLSLLRPHVGPRLQEVPGLSRIVDRVEADRAEARHDACLLGRAAQRGIGHD